MGFLGLGRRRLLSCVPLLSSHGRDCTDIGLVILGGGKKAEEMYDDTQASPAFSNTKPDPNGETDSKGNPKMVPNTKPDPSGKKGPDGKPVMVPNYDKQKGYGEKTNVCSARALRSSDTDLEPREWEK